MKCSYDEVSYNAPSERTLPPIIFLHGLFESSMTWKRVAPIIAKRTKRKAFLPDARNHGKSPWTSEMDYEVLTKDLEEFMDENRIKTAVIVGHSMGGRTAINFALKHPERTEALVIEDMTPDNIVSKGGTLVERIAYLAQELLGNIPPETDLESVRTLIFNLLIDIAGERYVDAKRAQEQIDVAVIPIKKMGECFAVQANMDAILDMIQTNALAQNLPDTGLTYDEDALFLYGSRPFFNLEKDDTIQKLFPRAFKRKIEGSSHYIHLDNPDVFVEVVSEFILLRNLPSSKY